MLEYCVNQAVHGSGDRYGGDSMQKKKKLPIGIEFFKDFKRDNFYYVDKTSLIRDLIDLRGSVNLFTRPEYGYAENILRNWYGFVFI